MTSRLGLGLAALGRPGYMTLGHAEDLGDHSVAAMEQRCHTLLDAAWSRGVRYVDTARSYGRAEEFLASWIASRNPPPSELTVASKWGYTYTANWSPVAAVHEVKDHTLAAFERQLAESRALFGDRLSIYQIHSVTPDSPALADTSLLDALARLRDSGVTVGLTVSGPRQPELIRRALGIEVAGAPLFGCVQATFNLHERSAAPALAEAHAAGLRVIVKEGMANGRLARTAPAPLLDHARALATTPDSVALAAILAQPFVDIVLSGAVTVEQLDRNLRAATLTLDPDLLPELIEPPADYWSTRSALPWT